MYMKDCYLKEWDAEVTEVNGKFIVLNQSAFYPESGGQLTDKGKLIKDGEEFEVVFVKKIAGKRSHEVDKEGLKEGDKVHCILDWERRYKLMRYHTAAHIISTIINEETGAKITGNQLTLEKARIDYDLEQYDKDLIFSFENKVNKVIEKNLSVDIKIMPREEAFKIPALVKLKMLLPESIKEIRVIGIEGFDEQACAGTHVKNTSEIGKVTFTKAENKGKNNRRLYFTVK